VGSGSTATTTSTSSIGATTRGPWLLQRLREKWPTIGDGGFLGKIHAWNASNEFLFIRNDLAVALAVVMWDNVDRRPYVRAIFVFARDGAAQSSPGEKAIVALYRRMREWATSMRATRVYFSGRSDIGLSRRRTLLSAERKPRSLQPQHSSAVQRPVSGPLRPIQRADAAGRVCPEDDPHDAASEWVGWGRWPWATSANAQSCQSCLLRTKRQIGRPLLTQPASGALGS
jgi:hypothetical protein